MKMIMSTVKFFFSWKKKSVWCDKKLWNISHYNNGFKKQTQNEESNSSSQQTHTHTKENWSTKMPERKEDAFQHHYFLPSSTTDTH